MDNIDVFLFPQGDEGTGFRTKNAPDEPFRRVLIDRGEALIARAAIVGITNGTLNSDGDPATLLVFEFRFLSMKSSRRFIRSTITITFDDASGNPKLCPEVYQIAPEGTFALNKSTTLKNVKQSANVTLNADVSGVGANAGYVWEMEEAKGRDYWTKLSGVKKLLIREYGDDNAVIWSLEENKNKKDGIPSFFRTAVLLRRSDDVPFSFAIKVRTEVDFVSEIRTLVGLEKPDPVDPVEIDPENNPKDMRVGSLNPEKVDLTNMEALNLGEHADVVIATVLQTVH